MIKTKKESYNEIQYAREIANLINDLSVDANRRNKNKENQLIFDIFKKR